MQFNTYEFAVFFLVVYSLYLRLSHRWQNILLLAASYFFYGWWNWRLLPLLLFSTAVAFFCGLKIEQSRMIQRKKIFLIIGICTNLLILSVFKYFNFFADNLQNLVGFFGFSLDKISLKVILPIGISFYTFQKMSYLIDIYRGEVKPAKNFLDFALFAAFFPQLVAGPIERARHLLPQVLQPREIGKQQFRDGCYLILWGLFKKVFVADNCAKIVNMVFASAGHSSGGEVLIGVYAFAFQIYGDFSGYSDMARGLAKLLGFDLINNFNLPYFATGPSEFWRRWHISLSTWFRDYVYIPLGGSRKGTFSTYRNLLLTMALCGLWHGAAWTFILWGFYIGFLLVLDRLIIAPLDKIQINNTALKRLWFFIRILGTFQLICLGWLIFRAQSIEQVVFMLKDLIFNFKITSETVTYGKQLIGYVSPLLFIEVIQFFKEDLDFQLKLSFYGKTAYLASVLYLLVIYGTSKEAFIYFQF